MDLSAALDVGSDARLETGDGCRAHQQREVEVIVRPIVGTEG
jgi:hypothetical protein